VSHTNAKRRFQQLPARAWRASVATALAVLEGLRLFTSVAARAASVTAAREMPGEQGRMKGASPYPCSSEALIKRHCENPFLFVTSQPAF